MAHEIDMSTGKAAVFTTREPAWHGLGVTIKSAATSAEAISLAGLDWAVEQWPVRAHLTDEHGLPVMNEAGEPITSVCPGKVANVRTDTNEVVGVVSPFYRVFQNAEAFDFMDTVVGEKLAMYETAGSLKRGRRVWMLARIPKEYRVGEDVVEPYVLLTNAHDGTQSLRMIPTTVRVVCQNTLTYAIGQAGKTGLRIPHWPKLESRVKEARKNLGIISSQLDQFGVEMQAMSDRKLTAAESKDYFRALFPTQTEAQAEAARAISTEGLLDSIIDNQAREAEVVDDLLAGHYAATERKAKRNAQILETVLGNFENDRNNLPGIEHSAWSAYNSVSEWVDHGRESHGSTARDRAENRLESVWTGTGNGIKQEAYQSALSLVN